MNIIIYEDEGHKNFLPLTWTRPVYDLRCGINTLAEKVIRQYPKAKVDFSCRYYLPGQKVMKFEKGLFINGRILAHSRLAKEIPLKGKDEVFYSGDEIVAIRAVS
ncbi:MAG: putative sugar nucleotidyl transferase, partial [Candidatus Margulisiibacteriota bacterium]